MVNLSVVHVLLFVVLAFLLYHLLGNCGCTNGVVDGFSVGGQICSDYKEKETCDGPCLWNYLNNTCSPKSVFCNPNVKNPPQRCPGDIECPDCGYNKCECPKPPCILNPKTPGYTEWAMPNTCTCPENTEEVTITNSRNQKVSRCKPKSQIDKCTPQTCWDANGVGYPGFICPADVILDKKIYKEDFCCNMSRQSKNRSCREAWRKK